MKDNIVAGLDIGSTSIRLVIGQRISGMAGDELQIIGAVSGPTAGVSRGIVNSIEETTSSISAVLEKAERLVGVPISRVWVSINDPHIKCERSKGVVAVGRSDGEINENDVNRAIEAARALAVPVNYEILHVIPIKFSVDNQSDVKDPIGMNGIRLEVETLIVQGLSTQIKNLTKAIYRTGLEIEDLVLAPLAASEAVLSSKQKELGVALINLGSSTTSLAVYEERNLIHTAILPIGAEHITADVAIGLRCPINLAERIKREYGSAVVIDETHHDDIDISGLVKEEEVNDDINSISRKYVSEIINARVEEIFDKIDNEFKKIDRSGMLPASSSLSATSQVSSSPSARPTTRWRRAGCCTRCAMASCSPSPPTAAAPTSSSSRTTPASTGTSVSARPACCRPCGRSTVSMPRPSSPPTLWSS
jgi:cell division protein FtsA